MLASQHRRRDDYVTLKGLLHELGLMASCLMSCRVCCILDVMSGLPVAGLVVVISTMLRTLMQLLYLHTGKAEGDTECSICQATCQAMLPCRTGEILKEADRQ